MIFDSSDFVFRPPEVISRARRVLIKPSALYPVPYPVTTSPDILRNIITAIRQVSDADILILEGTATGAPVYPIYEALGYSFPRVITTDVKDCTLVEVDNPLPKPFAMPTFWVPNVVLSSDFLITVSPLKTFDSTASLSIPNLLTLLPMSKYKGDASTGWGALNVLGLDKVLADLYFTLPMDLAIVEAKQKLTIQDDPTHGEVEDYGKIFVGEPYLVDCEISERLSLKTEYLSLIKTAKAELET